MTLISSSCERAFKELWNDTNIMYLPLVLMMLSAVEHCERHEIRLKLPTLLWVYVME